MNTLSLFQGFDFRYFLINHKTYSIPQTPNFIHDPKQMSIKMALLFLGRHTQLWLQRSCTCHWSPFMDIQSIVESFTVHIYIMY